MSKELTECRKKVEEVIGSYLPEETGYQKVVLEAMNYSMLAGGKRIRPLMMYLVYTLFGGHTQEIQPFMAAIEMIHTSSLIHDDLPCMDDDQLRRGFPTTWVKYGYDMAVLAGDALLIYAVETAVKAFALTDKAADVGRCIGILAQKTGIYGMIGGQTVDVEMTGKEISKERLDFIYRLKTGALLEASMMIGGILGGADEIQLKTVEKMAVAIGLAFQIQDDVLDVVSNSETLGKPVFSDEKNQKTTYVTLDGIEAARKAAESYSREAVTLLHSLPGKNQILEELILMLVNREK